MIVFGIGLISLSIIISMPMQQQNYFTESLTIFDLHEQIPLPIETIKFVAWEAPQNYFDEFYLAFEQTMSVGQNEIEDWARVAQQTNLSHGRVLGISLEDSWKNCDSLKLEAEIPYSFVSPKRILLINVISP